MQIQRLFPFIMSAAYTSTALTTYRVNFINKNNTRCVFLGLFKRADLANLVNEAALLSARLGLKKVGQQQLEQSIERVIAGPEKTPK